LCPSLQSREKPWRRCVVVACADIMEADAHTCCRPHDVCCATPTGVQHALVRSVISAKLCMERVLVSVRDYGMVCLAQEWADMMKREVERFTARVPVDFRGKVASVAVTSSADTWAVFLQRCLATLLPVATQTSLQ
jgi:hypothetical protein